ncbi:MAG: helix-turn-helix domain-containing protein [Candidatus Hodarchaeota archaeon]
MNELLGIEEVAKILNVPRSWVYERTRRGEIPHFKLGKYLRFDAQAIEKFVEKMRRGKA